MTTPQRMILAAFSAASLACGCAASPVLSAEGVPAEVAAAVASDPARLLSRCERLAPDPEVTSWDCGKLTAVESVVRTASPREVALAFEGFAASFGGERTRRVDSVYARGVARHAVMRLERDGPGGEQREAEMVAVAVGNGVRLVTCSTTDADMPCAPVVAHLVRYPP